MAKSAKKPAGKSSKPSGGRPASANARKSVAAARASSKNSNKIQIIIGSVAILLMIAAVVVGVMMAKKNNKKPVEGYGDAKVATASFDADGILVLSKGTPTATIDVYADPICPACGAFEAQFGEQIFKAADEGKLAVKYRFLSGLDPQSASKTYSSRAVTAIVALTSVDGQKPGVVANYISTLFKNGVQPKEKAHGDHSNDDLAAFAQKVGASDEAVTAIKDGTFAAQAKDMVAKNSAELRKYPGPRGPGTPTVVYDNKWTDYTDPGWLTRILAGADGGAPASGGSAPSSGGAAPASGGAAPSGESSPVTSVQP